MSIRIVDLLAHVPPAARPDTLNDTRTIDGLSVGIEPRVIDWALATAHTAVEETYRDIAPTRFEALAHETARSIEAISLNLIRYLLGGRETAAAVRVSRAQQDVTVNAVRLGIPLHRIIGGLRTLDHVWKTAFIALVLDVVAREDAVEVLSHVDRTLSTYFDALVDDNARRWTEENQRLSDRRALGQRQLVEQIVAGRRVDAPLVSEVLGLGPGDQHVGLILSAAPNGDAPAFDFAGFRIGLEQRLPRHVVTFLPADGETVWAFVSGARVNAAALREAVADVLAEAPHALVSLGLPMTGTAGLRGTHLTAASAHSFNRLTSKAGPIVSFSDVGLLALVTQSPELAMWFVDNEIGPLLDKTPQRDELLKTLEALIEHSGSLVRTAEALYVHRNTVTYRLKKIEEALGRDPLARPGETRTALRLAELL